MRQLRSKFEGKRYIPRLLCQLWLFALFSLTASLSWAQAESELSDIVYYDNDLCITGWVKIRQWGVGHGAPVNLVMAQLHAYDNCPSFPLPEGGGDVGSATQYDDLGDDTLATRLETFYWDWNQSRWTVCHNTQWQYDGNASTAAQSEVVTSCPRQSYLKAKAYLWVNDNNGWKGGILDSGYYYFN